MNTSLNENSEALGLSNQGPGEMLRSSRRAQDISISEVVDKLHLTQDLIRALESDDFESLPDDVFVQGYLKNYARFLEEPVESILQAYREVRPQVDAVERKLAVSSGGYEIRSHHGVVRFFTWLIVLGLIVLLGFWWKGYLGDASEAMLKINAYLPDSQTESVEIMLNKEDADQSIDVNIKSNDNAPMINNPESNMPKIDPKSIKISRVVTDRIEANPVNEATVDLVVEAKISQSNALTTVNEASSESISMVETSQPNEADAAVVLSLRSTSWVDIRDAKGASLIRAELPAGTIKSIKGLSPYFVVLGKPSSVDIQINGEPYDMSSYIDGRVARFYLNP